MFFLYFHGLNKYKIRNSAHYIGRTKTLNNIKVRKRQKYLQSIVHEKEERPCLLYLIQIFGNIIIVQRDM
jgi:hypothetical protein